MTTDNSEFQDTSSPEDEKPAKVAKPKAAKPAVTAKKSSRITIVVEKSGKDDSVSQFFGINGKGYLITFGEPVSVPRELLNVLDEAIETKTIPLPEGGFIEKDFKRFPYRIVSEK